MHYQPAAEFGLKPSGLWRHDLAAIGDIHDLLHRDRIECEGGTHFSTVHTTLELSQATQTANKVDAVAAAEVAQLQDLFEDEAAVPFDLSNGKMDDDILSENDMIFQQLWRTYFKAICIKERMNPKKQLSDMPRRYWKYMTEKNEHL